MGFLVALQFLTILPSTLKRPIGQPEMGRSMRWFPAVGLVIGGVAAALDYGLGFVTTSEIRSVAVVALLAILTGGLHLDGCMDSCDGLFAFASPQRRLEIMADSRVGSFGLVGAITLLLLKFAAILALPAAARPAGFLAMGALSRWSTVYATVRYPAARASGLGYAYKQTAGRTELALATALAIAGIVPAGPAGAGALLVAWLLTVGIARYATARIGGLTGDVYGAISEAVEVAVLISLPPLWRLGSMLG